MNAAVKQLIDFEALDLGPRLEALGPNLLVPFVAHRLPAARVLWINERWWAGRGVDVGQPQARLRLENWLLGNYAYCVKTPDLAGHLGDDTAVFFADRYGATGGAHHGGSGRCGIRGMLNAKGVGPTPLVGAQHNVDWIHSHGCAWVEEAVREAIASEVAHAEFPHGAVPTVAIIDCGLDPSLAYNQHRALILRPNFVRLAHLERSGFFGDAGHPDADQYKDALRTRDALEAVWGPSSRRQELGVRSASLAEAIARLADQLAFGYAHRLFIGGISSSNLTIDGQIVDFGLFTSVSCWRRTHGQLALPAFGEEWSSVMELVRSVGFFQNKYLGLAADLNAIAGEASARLYRGFATFAAQGVGIDAEGADDQREAIVAILRGYFAEQNKTADLLRAKGRRPWLYGALGANSGDAAAKGAAEQLRRAIRPEDSAQGAALWEALRRFLLPRPWLHWDRIHHKVKHLTATNGRRADFPAVVQAFIDKGLSRSRRLWPNLETGDTVVAQSVQTACSALWCWNGRDRAFILHLEAVATPGDQRLFGRLVRGSSLPDPVRRGDMLVWRLPVGAFSPEAREALARDGLRLPAFEAYVLSGGDSAFAEGAARPSET